MGFDAVKKIEELKKSDMISSDDTIDGVTQEVSGKYELVKAEVLKDMNSAGLILRHKKSGARVVVISNDDNNKVFSIGFKTPPFDDTGMQHIIEHSTLCGSRKYPVKDPFVELCKGSLNTFLNAMTYPDKTVYPVASCNDADFKNIMDVYMDAVFYPDMYNRPEIFKQEGWHYELEDINADIKYNGVVFNEMKGVYSSAEDVLSRYTFNSLFPDTVYCHESGGDPEVITTLKYEDFLKYHSEYYHPSNSYIYMYGDMDVNERLKYLDEEYLSAFNADDVNIHANIPLQKAFDKPVYDTRSYAVTEDESLENNTYLSYNVVAGTSVDAKLYLALQILDYALVMAPGAPLKQALIDAGISTDVYSSLETSIYQPVYSIIAKNADLKDQDIFVDTVERVLGELVKNGISERTIAAGINYYEFKYREADYGPYPKGLMYYLTMMDSWLYDESKPFIHIEAGDTFDELKKEAKQGYFEELISRYILNNNHKSVLSLVPEYGLEKKKEEKEAARLADYKTTLSVDELKELVESTKELKEYQDTPSSQEELEKIPMLELSDISREPAKLYIDVKEVAGMKVVHHNIFTNKIAYIMLSFNTKGVCDEDISYLGLLGYVLGLMDTKNFTYPELTNEININCGGISSSASIYSDKVDFSKQSIMYEVKGKALYEKIPFVLDMMKEIMYNTKFDDYKRLKEIIARVRSRLEATLMGAGHSIAMLEGCSQFSKSAYYQDLIKGYRFYEFIKEIDETYEDNKENIADKLSQLVNIIFNKDNVIVSVTADEEGYCLFEDAYNKMSESIRDEHVKEAERRFTPVNVKTAYSSASQVQYVARCGNFVNAGFEYTGALKVLKVIFSYEYLWLNVRVKGGAYGCMSGSTRDGDFYMVSYRDPNLVKTNEIYEGAADYVKNFDVSRRDMVKFIIGTIGEMDSPLTPSAMGMRSFTHYICNTSMEMLRKDRAEVLDATVESIRALAPLIDAAVKQNYLCVVGGQKAINEAKELFDEVKPLI